MNSNPQKLTRIDRHPIPNDLTEIRIFSVIRNEKRRLPFFLKYYQELGISRFFLIDNNSTDHVESYLLPFSNVHLFRSTASYEYTANHFSQELAEKYGRNQWCLFVDPDELFSFPFQEFVSLQEFIQYYEQKKLYAVRSLLLDMYSDKKISETVYVAGTNPFKDCRYFDRPNKYLWKSDRHKLGGVRHRKFGLKHINLTKFPLCKLVPEIHPQYWGYHHNPGVPEGPENTVLFHFKFFSSFISLAKEEAKREQHYDQASEYKAYAKGIKGQTTLYSSLHSVKFFHILQLTFLNLISIDRGYLWYILMLLVKKLKRYLWRTFLPFFRTI